MSIFLEICNLFITFASYKAGCDLMETKTSLFCIELIQDDEMKLS